MATTDDDLKRLRGERRELITAYGDRGQRHYMNVNIGGLNPAAQRLHAVRGQIAEAEASRRGPRAELTLLDGRTGKGSGLQYEVRFGQRVGKVGLACANESRNRTWYVVEDGEIVSDGHKTAVQAAKAFERIARHA